jgi:AcrR family transcriptional regulator
MGRTKTISDADLLETARQVFVEKGFGAPTKEIARRAGVSEGVLFQRYATKGELFFAAMVLPAADLTGLLRTRRLTGPRDLESIAVAMVRYFRSTMPVLLSLMSQPGFRFEEFARRHPDSPLDALRRGLVVFLVEQREAGRIGPVDPGGAALTIFALAQSIAFFEQMGAHGGRMPDEVLRRAIRSLWDGFAPRRRTRRPPARRTR